MLFVRCLRHGGKFGVTVADHQGLLTYPCFFCSMVCLINTERRYGLLVPPQLVATNARSIEPAAIHLQV